MANILAEAAPTGAENAAAKVEDAESMPYKTASERFHRLFTVGADEKLVSYYSCCLLGGGLPAQVQIQCYCALIFDTMIVIHAAGPTFLSNLERKITKLSRCWCKHQVPKASEFQRYSTAAKSQREGPYMQQKFGPIFF